MPTFKCVCSCGQTYESQVVVEFAMQPPHLVSLRACPRCVSLVGVQSIADASRRFAARRDVKDGDTFYDFDQRQEFLCERATPVVLHISDVLMLSSGTGYGGLPVLIGKANDEQ